MSGSASSRAKRGGKGHGGARRGAGRKAGSLPPDLAAHLVDVATVIGSPIKLARWYTVALALLSAARLRGLNVKAIDKLAKEIRANATAAGKVIPHDIQFSAAQLIRHDEDEMKRDKGPDEEERDAARPSSAVRASEA